MKPLENKIARVIREHALIGARETVLVAVSAGPDSMALLHVLGALREEINFSLCVAYVDHGLRPHESPHEIELVQNQAKDMGIPCRIGNVDVPTYVKEHGLSTEDGARTLRYGFLAEVAAELGAHKIAVAHTADDQAEEVLLRLIRGTGKKGLSGMDFVREGGIIRPFLATPKAELLEYLSQNTIPFLEDSSNRQRSFLRNRIRLDLIPFLEKDFNPNIGATLRQTAIILGEEEEYLDTVANGFYNKIVKKNRKTETLPEISFDVPAFGQLPIPIQRRVVEKIFWNMSNRPGFRQIEQIVQLAAGQKEGSAHFSNGLRASLEKGRLVFSYPKGMVAERGDLSIDAKQSFAVELDAIGSYELEEIGSFLHLEILASGEVDLQEQPEPNQSIDFLDAGKITFPLLVRSMQPGDRFHPLGAPGSKKVGDWLTDRKVPAAKRWQVPVLVSGGTIVALLGYRIDQQFRVTEKTSKVLKVTMTGL
jgi:tRNA(Ile)-lysidine synthase